jgi:integrase
VHRSGEESPVPLQSSLALDSGSIHSKIVQEILHHAQITMTLDTYSHLLPATQQEAMNGMLFP